MRRRRLRTRVVGRVDREQAGTAVRVHAVAARRADCDLRAQAREAHLRARVPQARDARRTGAIRRRSDRAALVAGRHDDEHAARRERADYARVCRAARPERAEAHVLDLRGIRIVRHTIHVKPACPRHRLEDVGVEPSALAEHTDRQDPRAPSAAGHTFGVVRARTDDSRNAGAVPRAIPNVATGELALVRLLLRDPVARVRRICVSSVAVVGGRRVRNEVVAGKHASAEMRALQIRVIQEHAGVENRDHDACVAGACVPGGLRVNRARRVDAVL